MLVISRKKGETLVIGDGIEVSVVDIQGDRVRVGISAPREVRIMRREPTSTPPSSSPRIR